MILLHNFASRFYNSSNSVNQLTKFINSLLIPSNQSILLIILLSTVSTNALHCHLAYCQQVCRYTRYCLIDFFRFCEILPVKVIHNFLHIIEICQQILLLIFVITFLFDSKQYSVSVLSFGIENIIYLSLFFIIDYYWRWQVIMLAGQKVFRY